MKLRDHTKMKMSEFNYVTNGGEFNPSENLRNSYRTLPVIRTFNIVAGKGNDLDADKLHKLAEEVCVGLNIKYNERIYQRIKSEINSRVNANCLTNKIIVGRSLYVMINGIAWIGDPTTYDRRHFECPRDLLKMILLDDAAGKDINKNDDIMDYIYYNMPNIIDDDTD